MIRLDAPPAAKPPADPRMLAHRVLRDGEFWRTIPKYREIDEATFLDHVWQGRNSVKTPEELLETARDLAPAAFLEDARQGFVRAPMAVRVSPYIFSLIDWTDPYDDPIRRQFIPLASSLLPDHPRLVLDSLHEQQDAPVPGLVHRYVDKALFLTVQTCPVYCRFCTRSYAIGPDTEDVDKVLLATPREWEAVFAYIASRPELEDIVISGGDAYQLPPKSILTIGQALLAIPHVRRMRFATKGPAVMPMKILSDGAWLDALTLVVEEGRKLGKEVSVHTHFNHPNEITEITRRAMQQFLERGITVRNQSVLVRGVNDDEQTMELLIKRLSYVNVHPYYVYMHDLVKGVEDLRTSIARAIEIEKYVRGATAGYNTPAFVCDAPGGGGKRDVHSYEYYDRVNGIAVYTAPSVKPGKYFLYFDPIAGLAADAQARWRSADSGEEMVAEALVRAGASPNAGVRA
ncbi:MAG: KamA family radical SAM protein [Candidatus Eremiobacteraeota bacterium]|nr:KamA family radical SAM protein [Candidatus Eremiobacteraeota bacterium]